MRCKTKQREDSRSEPAPKKFGADPRVSSHAVETRVETRPAPVFRAKMSILVDESVAKLGLEDK